MKRIFAILRVLGLSIAILVVCVVVTMRRAEARITEALRGFGDELASIARPSLHSTPRKLFVNGLELKIVTASTPLSVHDALDRFQGICRTVGELDLPAAIRQKLGQASKEPSASSNGVIRQEAGSEGFLACLDLGRKLDGGSFLLHLSEFGKTGNLRSLGQLRYALARRRDGRTSLVMFGTEGDAMLADLFPKQGDAPGRDLVDVPRPASSRRLLSAFEQGMPYGLAGYGIDGQPLAAVGASYKALLRSHGWAVRGLENGVWLAEKAKRRVLVRIAEQRLKRVVVTLSDLG